MPEAAISLLLLLSGWINIMDQREQAEKEGDEGVCPVAVGCQGLSAAGWLCIKGVSHYRGRI